MYKLTTLDSRYSGYGTWKYQIKSLATVSKRKYFLDWRTWCWESWGPSKELVSYTQDDLYDGVHSSNSHWCWSTDRLHASIYLRSDIEATAFSLKWL